MLTNIKTTTLIGVAGIAGMAAGVMGLTYAFKVRRDVVNAPYYKQAFSLLNRNKIALQLLGEPIKVNHLDLSDTKRNKVHANSVRLSIPITGKLRKGYLCFVAYKIDSNEWLIKKVELNLDGDLKNKRIIVYRDQ